MVAVMLPNKGAREGGTWGGRRRFPSLYECILVEVSLAKCRHPKLFKICIIIGFNCRFFFSPVNHSLLIEHVFLTSGIADFGESGFSSDIELQSLISSLD